MTPLWHWLDANPALTLTAALLVALLLTAYGGQLAGWWPAPRANRRRVDDAQDEREVRRG